MAYLLSRSSFLQDVVYICVSILLSLSSLLCSLSAELLALLEWGWSGSTDTETLRHCLEGLRRVPSEELMVFLQDTLDVLLEILMNSSTDDDSDNKVFEALASISVCC